SGSIARDCRNDPVWRFLADTVATSDTNWSGCPLRSRNLLVCVSVCAKYAVRLRLRRPARRPKMGIHIFPDGLTSRRYFKQPAKHAFIDQRVSIGQPLRVRDPIAVKTLTLVLPDDVVRRWIDLDYSRRGKRLIQARGTVIEYQNVAIRQRFRRVLA